MTFGARQLDPEPSPPPDPPSGFPDATNTGPTEPELIPETASGLVESSANGEVLENFHATRVIIEHDNVTVRNFKITRSDPSLWYALTQLNDPINTTIEDGEITTQVGGVDVPGSGHAINGSEMIVRRMHIHHCKNGIQGNFSTYEDNYIHSLFRRNSDHNNGIVTYGPVGGGGGLIVRHNTVLMLDEDGNGQQTGAMNMFSINGLVDDVLIDQNFFDGGTYTMYHRDQGGGVPTNIVVTDNAWGRRALFGRVRSDGPEEITSTGNYWIDDPGNPFD